MDLSIYMAVVKSDCKKHFQKKVPHLLFLLLKVKNASLTFVSLIIFLMVIAECYSTSVKMVVLCFLVR